VVLNRSLITVALIIVSIIIIAALTYSGRVDLNFGIIISILLVILPTLVDYELKPKVDLKISDLRFTKNTSRGVAGYQLEAIVTNGGKKICLNLCASFEIKDAQGTSPNLLHLRYGNRNGQETVEQNEETMREARYRWLKKGGREYSGNWDELRQNDSVSLLFPYEVISVSAGSNTSEAETLLKLLPNSRYKVVVEVKGEDSERNTAIGNKKQTLTTQKR